MAKTKIQEYDSTAGNNTDIDSINIAEGWAAANVNNALRALMGHIKTALSGSDDSLITGTAGTANNLAMWNGDSDLVDASGVILTADLTVGDNVDIKFGTGGDVDFYFNGTATWIGAFGTNNAQFRTDGTFSVGSADNTETMLTAVKDGAVTAYYDNVVKLATTSAGADVTGQLSVTDDAYAAGWNGSTDVPTKNAVYDKVESLPFKTEYLSGAQTPSAGGLMTLAHSLGVAPKLIRIAAEVTTADAGFSIGDFIDLTATVQRATEVTQNTGLAVYYDSTNVYIRLGS